MKNKHITMGLLLLCGKHKEIERESSIAKLNDHCKMLLLVSIGTGQHTKTKSRNPNALRFASKTKTIIIINK